jgi:long-chain acyl-CoA synthetase
MSRQTVLSYLDSHLRRGDAVVFAHQRGLREVRWSYKQLATTAYKFARELEIRGIQRGERVLLCGGNSPEWAASFWGCLLRGAVVVPLDKENTPAFASSVQQQTEAKLIVASSDVAASSLRILQLRLESLGEQVEHHSGEPYTAEGINQDTLVEIIFTSGTTSAPKGVMLTHGNLLANLLPLEAEIEKYIRWERFFRPIRFLNLVPLSHVFGQFMGLFVPQLLGGEIHFQESFNPSEIIRRTRSRRISVIVLVPRLLESLREWVEQDYAARGQSEELQRLIASTKDTNFLRRWWVFRRVHNRFGWKFWAFISGGATLEERTETFWRRLGFAVLQGYGMTETASLITVTHPFKGSRGSLGKLMPGYEAKLDETGEIIVRGASVSPGYWARENNIKRRADDWLRTGDIGALDDKGNLYFKGRKKDAIVTAAGLNIYPEDLEAALNRQPEVRASCVIAVDGAHGTEPLAVIILRAPEEGAEDAVNRANTELAEYQQIRRWFIWTAPDFPRTATHKVIKREVAAVVENKIKTEKTMAVEDVTDDTASSPSAFILSHVKRTTESVPAKLDPSVKLSDLRLDSLGRVELLSALEDRYQIEIDEGMFTAATTVGDVEKIIRGEIEERVGAPYPYPKWTRARFVRWIRVLLFYTIIMPITRLTSRMRVRGSSHLERIDGPALFISNHVTLADHALILAGLPARFRHRLAIAMEGELLRDWRHPPEEIKLLTRLRWRAQYVLINLFFHVFPLPKHSGFRQSFAYAGECLDRGESLLVFPEGMRAPLGQMHMGSFKTGIGLLAKELNVAVVPLKLDGLYELKRRKQYFAAPGDVQVIFGEPMSLDLKMNPAEVTREMERRIATL